MQTVFEISYSVGSEGGTFLLGKLPPSTHKNKTAPYKVAHEKAA